MSDNYESLTLAEESFGIVKDFGELPPGAIVTEVALARIFDRHDVSVKRAVERGKLPPSVRIFGKPVWTVRAILAHIESRLEAAKQRADEDAARIAMLSP